MLAPGAAGACLLASVHGLPTICGCVAYETAGDHRPSLRSRIAAEATCSLPLNLLPLQSARQATYSPPPAPTPRISLWKSALSWTHLAGHTSLPHSRSCWILIPCCHPRCASRTSWSAISLSSSDTPTPRYTAGLFRPASRCRTCRWDRFDRTS